jgi:serine/threonine-protein kinase
MTTQLGLPLRYARNVPSASDDWEFSELLAEDRWTQTYRAILASNRGGAEFAVKLMQRNLSSAYDRELAQGLLRREATVSSRVRQRNLATTLEVLRRGDEISLLQPSLPDAALRPNTSLMLVIRLWIIRQIAQALAALHKDGWLHGNLSANAIRVSTSGHATLGELGWCRKLGTEECDLGQAAFAGQIEYAAPEMFADAGQLTPAADVYSLGVVLFQLLTGHGPFADFDVGQHIAVKRLRPVPVDDVDAPYEIRKILSRMLNRDPLRRPAVADAIQPLAAAEIACFS